MKKQKLHFLLAHSDATGKYKESVAEGIVEYGIVNGYR